MTTDTFNSLDVVMKIINQKYWFVVIFQAKVPNIRLSSFSVTAGFEAFLSFIFCFFLGFWIFEDFDEHFPFFFLSPKDESTQIKLSKESAD